MKKIFSLIVSLICAFTLSGCTNSKNDTDILTFFNALNQSLQQDSATVKGSLISDAGNESSIDVLMEWNQTSSLEAIAKLSISAGGNSVDDFLTFYLKDNKTYLDALGTKTQSTVENLGLDPNTKLDRYNPFLSLSNEELCSFFTSSSVTGDTYTFEIDKNALSQMMNSYNDVTVKNAQLVGEIKDGLIRSIWVRIDGSQSLAKNQDYKATLDLNISDYNKTDAISFPKDLDTYTKE